MNATRSALHPATVTSAVSLLLALAMPAARAEAGGKLSEASELSAIGSASLVAGSVASVVGTGELVVESIEWLADGARCVFRGSVEVGRVVLIIPVKIAGAASLAVGQTVLITAKGTGWLITKAGKVIAFIPNEIGQELLFSESVTR